MTPSASRPGKYMSNDNLEERITTIIALHHKGRDNAVSAKKLATKAGVSERKVRAIIAHLVDSHGQLIGSHPSRGFFMIVDREDMDLAERQLKSRALKILKRWSRLTKQPVPALARQLEMYEGEI